MYIAVGSIWLFLRFQYALAIYLLHKYRYPVSDAYYSFVTCALVLLWTEALSLFDMLCMKYIGQLQCEFVIRQNGYIWWNIPYRWRFNSSIFRCRAALTSRQFIRPLAVVSEQSTVRAIRRSDGRTIFLVQIQVITLREGWFCQPYWRC
jgi:hypothetical protein